MPYFIINGKDGKLWQVFINAEKRGRIKSIIKIMESRKLYLRVALKQRRKHASILLSQGVQLLTISRRLGHSDANITLKTYSHILDEMKISEAKKIKEILVHGTNTEQNL